MALRFSTRPHKQFLWFLIRRDASFGKGLAVGLDAGCADMGNRRFFETAAYIGVDPDAALLAKGKGKYPDAEIHNCKILEATVSADFVHCIQVFVNADFAKHEAVEATRKLVSMVRPGGVLLMNTGAKTIQYDQEICELLQSAFEEVTEIRYGNFGVKRVPLFFSLAIAAIMYLIPAMRLVGGHSKTYFRCVARKSSV